MKLALQGEFVPDAVNVQAGGVVAEEVRPLLPLAEKLGRVFTAVAGGVAASVTVEVRGEIVANDVSVLKLAATKGLFALGGRGAGHLRQRAACWPPTAGVEVELTTAPETIDHPNLVTVRGALPDGRVGHGLRHRAVTGPRESRQADRARRLRPGARAEGVLLFFRYADRPGVVGTIGTLLGEAGVNIAAMQVARREAGGEALMTLTVDTAVRGGAARAGRRGDRRHRRLRRRPDRLTPRASQSPNPLRCPHRDSYQHIGEIRRHTAGRPEPLHCPFEVTRDACDVGVGCYGQPYQKLGVLGRAGQPDGRAAHVAIGGEVTFQGMVQGAARDLGPTGVDPVGCSCVRTAECEIPHGRAAASAQLRPEQQDTEGGRQQAGCDGQTGGQRRSRVQPGNHPCGQQWLIFDPHWRVC